MSAPITIESVGRRHYLRGDTFAAKDAIRSAGGHWDAEQRAWWVGKRAVAEALIASLAALPSSASSSSSSSNEAPGKDAIVAGRAKYKGRTYYIAGRVVRGRTHWDDSVEGIATRDGAKLLLHFRDGSRSFWAPRGEVQVIKAYKKGATIEKLERLAKEWREASERGECACSCHREPNAGKPGSILYDGCDRCGCEVTG